MSFPKSEERKKCWSARDSYWECLTDNNDDSIKCSQQRALFEKCCSSQWVKHFDRKREFIKYKEKLETEGFYPADSGRSKTQT
ncbi:cytochrome c oxidase assembly factor 6 homolog [Pomacea canaliculata]|uniref:cytochrome c oxidase assembly factor 6 homolog n=1 Tax=Pomacea canaliculata TaxID=400727 RepID=UPI000D730B2D|nr:cytochrome c oxidase assembly factor 6 homolog [Pomacea canaliculata]